MITNTSSLDLTQRALEISTVKNCIVNCDPFCPNLSVFQQKYSGEHLLSFEDFELVMSKTPKDVMIVFAGFSEPFLNTRAMDMIELAKSLGHIVTLSSTFVGFNPEDAPRLKVLDWMSWHAPDNMGVAHIRESQQIKDSIFKVLTTHGLKIDEIMRMDTRTGFFPEDRAGNAVFDIETTGFKSNNKRHVRGPFYCSKLIRPQPVLLPNLDVQLCCEDWALEEKLGSFRKQTYEEIVNGDVFKLISASRWHLDDKSVLCRGCSRAWSLPKAVAIEVGWKGYQRLYRYARKSSQV